MRNLYGLSFLVAFYALNSLFLINGAPVEEQHGYYEFDPTFNQELVPMDPNDNFLDAEILFKCKKHFKFVECLEHYLRKKYQHESETGYQEASNDEKTFNPEKRNSNISKEELLSFFRNAITKNLKLKSNIKTTRF